MKKLFLFLLLLLSLNLVLAVDDCPRGFDEGECTNPCGLYTDQDSNYICDHSQDELYLETVETHDEIELTGQELKTKTVSEVAQIYDISVSDYVAKLSEQLGKQVSIYSSFQLLHDNYGLEPSIAKDIAISIRDNQVIEIAEEKTSAKYKFAAISVVTIIAYLITFTLQKTKKIKLILHKRIWNVVLLIVFLVSGILGLLLVIRINYGWALNLPFNMLYWHVEAGTIMAWVTIFHVLEHLRFYKLIFVNKNK